MMTGKPRNFTAELADAMYGPGNWFYDLEGCPTPNSEKEIHRQTFEAVKPKLQSFPGTILIVGTGSNIEGGTDESFYTPIAHNILKKNKID